MLTKMVLAVPLMDYKRFSGCYPQYGTDFRGGTYLTKSYVSGKKACCNHCMKDSSKHIRSKRSLIPHRSGCIAWTYYVDSKTCELKDVIYHPTSCYNCYTQAYTVCFRSILLFERLFSSRDGNQVLIAVDFFVRFGIGTYFPS